MEFPNYCLATAVILLWCSYVTCQLFSVECNIPTGLYYVTIQTEQGFGTSSVFDLTVNNTLQVTTPTANSTYYSGTLLPVVWFDPSFIDGESVTVLVSIYSVAEEIVIQDILTQSSALFSHTFVLPQNTTSSECFAVVANTKTCGQSGVFNISTSSLMPINTPSYAVPGIPYSVNWTPSNSSSQAEITLLTQDTLAVVFQEFVPNMGTASLPLFSLNLLSGAYIVEVATSDGGFAIPLEIINQLYINNYRNGSVISSRGPVCISYFSSVSSTPTLKIRLPNAIIEKVLFPNSGNCFLVPEYEESMVAAILTLEAGGLSSYPMFVTFANFGRYFTFN